MPNLYEPSTPEDLAMEAAVNQLALFVARIYLVGTMAPAYVVEGSGYSPEELVQKADRLITACLNGLPLLEKRAPRA